MRQLLNAINDRTFNDATLIWVFLKFHINRHFSKVNFLTKF